MRRYDDLRWRARADLQAQRVASLRDAVVDRVPTGGTPSTTFAAVWGVSKASGIAALSLSLDHQAVRRLRDYVPPRDAPLPIEALRDLLGIVGALFAAWTRAKVGPIELEELAHIGRELKSALDMAKKTEAGTLGHRAAWSRAEDATRRLGHLVGKLEPLHPVLESAVKRALAADSHQTAGQPTQSAARKAHERSRR